jgi:hypothetical protein
MGSASHRKSSQNRQNLVAPLRVSGQKRIW